MVAFMAGSFGKKYFLSIAELLPNANIHMATLFIFYYEIIKNKNWLICIDWYL